MASQEYTRGPDSDNYVPENARAYILGYRIGEFAVEDESREAKYLWASLGSDIVGDLFAGFRLGVVVANSSLKLEELIASQKEIKHEPLT